MQGSGVSRLRQEYYHRSTSRRRRPRLIGLVDVPIHPTSRKQISLLKHEIERPEGSPGPLGGAKGLAKVIAGFGVYFDLGVSLRDAPSQGSVLLGDRGWYRLP